MRVILAGNTGIILSLCQLKMRILRFVVHTVLATKYPLAASETFTQRRRTGAGSPHPNRIVNGATEHIHTRQH